MVTSRSSTGAVGAAWDWHLVSAELRERGHDPVAVDLPSDEESAGWWEYADEVVHAVGDRSDVVVVAHSLGGFTAPLVCVRIPVDLLVLVAAMIPAPGELLADWWANTAYEGARTTTSSTTTSLLVSRRGEAARTRRGRQGDAGAVAPRSLAGHADEVLLCRDDRMFGATWARRHARERLGVDADEMDGGHYISSAGRASWPSGSWPTSRLAERRQGELDGVVEGHSAAFRPKGVGVPAALCPRAADVALEERVPEADGDPRAE